MLLCEELNHGASDLKAGGVWASAFPSKGLFFTRQIIFSHTHLQTDSKASWDSAGCGGNGCHCATCWKIEETLNLGLGNNHAIVIPFNNSHIIRKVSRCILEIYKLYIIEKHNITGNFSTQRWPCSCFVSYTKIFFKSLIITYRWF